jgi:hypothetical protein
MTWRISPCGHPWTEATIKRFLESIRISFDGPGGGTDELEMRDETRTRNTSYQDNVSAEGIAKCQVLGN